MKVLKSADGLTVLYRHLKSPLISFRFFVRCGSLNENKKEQGLCHALEHMYFAGTPSRDWSKIQSDFKKVGAYSNASTGFYYTEYEVLVPAENFEAAFEVSSDMLNNPTFPEDRWEEVEKRAVINEMLGFENDSGWVLQDMALIDFLGNKYHNPIGSSEVIEKSDIQRLLNFSDKYYTRDNTVLAVSGDVSEKQVLNVVKRYPTLKKGKFEKREATSFRLNYKEHKLRIPGVTSQPLIMFIGALPIIKTQTEFYEYQIAADLLSDLLMNEIREKRGLVYHIGASLGLDVPEVPMIHITTSAESSSALNKTIKEIQRVLKNAAGGILQADRILEAKMDLYRYSLLAESNPQEVTMRIGDMFLLGWKKDLLEEPKKFLRSLSSKKIEKKFTEICSNRFKLATLVGE
jgi:predicted Zn-dependent peptidase